MRRIELTVERRLVRSEDIGVGEVKTANIAGSAVTTAKVADVAAVYITRVDVDSSSSASSTSVTMNVTIYGLEL